METPQPGDRVQWPTSDTMPAPPCAVVWEERFEESHSQEPGSGWIFAVALVFVCWWLFFFPLFYFSKTRAHTQGLMHAKPALTTELYIHGSQTQMDEP